MKKRLVKPTLALVAVFILLAMLTLPVLAYTGAYGTLGMNTLNYDLLVTAEMHKVFDAGIVDYDNSYSFQYRPTDNSGVDLQQINVNYYSSTAWQMKNTNYLSFRALFPYARADTYLNLGGWSSNGNLRFTITYGGNGEKYAVLAYNSPLLVTQEMITTGSVTVEIYHDSGQSNNVYSWYLGAYVGTANISPTATTSERQTYSKAVWNTWELTKERYGIVTEEMLEDYYMLGYNEGYSSGKQQGYNEAITDAQEHQGVFTDLANSVFSAPLNFLQGLFGWELFGMNLWSLFRALFTVIAMFVVVTLIVKAVL